MSIASQITRLQNAKEEIVGAIEGKGVSVPTGSHYDDFAGLIDNIQQGGGGNPQALKSVTYTPSEAAIADEVTPDSGYDSIKKVNVSVGAVPSNYVGTSVPRKSSSDLTASGATVTAPAGFYPANASKAIPDASAPYLSAIYIEADGTASADVEIGTGGYIASDTYEANLSQHFPVQGAQTITPGTTNQTIASGKYLTGAQTILGDADLVASNIKKDVTIFGVTGTYEGGGGGITLDQVLTRAVTGDVVINIPQQSYGNAVMLDFYGMFRGNKVSSIKSTGLTWIPPHFVNMEGTPNTLAGRPLVSVEMDAQYCGALAFKYCSNLASVKLYNLTTGYHNYTGISANMFEYCTSLTTVAFPKLTRIESSFMKDCSSLTAVDFGALATFGGQNHFQRDMSLNVLIIRTSSVPTLTNINTFANTPFASGGTGGTLYVPSSLISSYQSASNWSTILGYANNSIQAIEGSQYENYYADGTPIT